MRLGIFKAKGEGVENWRLGAMDDSRMLDLSVAAAAYAAEHPQQSHFRMPSTIMDVLRQGDEATTHLRRVHDWVRDERRARPETQMSWLLKDCDFDIPLRPGKLITVARNYHEHVAEHGLVHDGKVPSASIKASSSLTGPYDNIVRPSVEKQLDYETELAVVIGKRCKNVSQSDAYDVIAGYTVLCDVVARQVLKIERAAGNQFLGKMFDSFGPLGPCLAMKDSIADPMNLTITTRVNGEVRQHGNTSAMIWNIPQLIAYFSQATLEPGDIISTGTPAGVAAGRKPHETPWFLCPGDIIECEVENVGTLRNRVVQAEGGSPAWDWAK